MAGRVHATGGRRSPLGAGPRARRGTRGGGERPPLALAKAKGSMMEKGDTANGPIAVEGATPILRTEHLGRRVGDKVIVEGVDIEVARGETLAISGPSGAGKSSLLRLLNRLDEPTEGTVFFEGRDYREMEPRELRRRVGMVLQRPFLFPGTVEENLRFAPESRGETVEGAEIADLLERMGLRGYESRAVRNLSGGEAQRVSLARTLANRPEVLLLDEPTSDLDERAEREIERLITGIIEARGLTCLIVTHDREQAARLARRGVVLERGRVVASGPTVEISHAE